MRFLSFDTQIVILQVWVCQRILMSVNKGYLNACEGALYMGGLRISFRHLDINIVR